MKENIITIIIVVVAVAAFFWWYRAPSPGIQTNAQIDGPSLELVNKLRNIKIDTSFFDDPQFVVLDEAPELSLEGMQRGRTNPFVSESRSSR